MALHELPVGPVVTTLWSVPLVRMYQYFGEAFASVNYRNLVYLGILDDVQYAFLDTVGHRISH